VPPSRIRDLRRTLKWGADLRIRFLVDSGRYPSIFDVMRDIRGITGRTEGYNHLCVGLQTEGAIGSSRRRFFLSLSLHLLAGYELDFVCLVSAPNWTEVEKMCAGRWGMWFI
jgi:hypothetical protein